MVCKRQKRMRGDHPPLLGCLKAGRDERAAPRAHTYKPLPALPTGAALQGGEHGWEPSSLHNPVGFTPTLCVHPCPSHLQTPSPPCSAMTPWQTQTSYSGWLPSLRMLNSGLKSQMLAEEELLWKGAGLGCQVTARCSSSQPPLHSPKLGALLRAPLFLHAGAVAAFPASRLQPCL